MLHAVPPDAIHIPVSTISVGLSRKLADSHVAARQGYLAAPAVPMPLAAQIRDHCLEGIALGYGDQDWSAIARVIADNAGSAKRAKGTP